MIFEIQREVPLCLCDCTDHLSLYGVARMFQDAADSHTTGEGIGYQQLLQEGKAWVLYRIAYQTYFMPEAGESVTLRTWSRGVDKLFALRDTQMFDSKGNLCVCSTSYWVIIDMERRRVCRMHDKVINYEHTPLQATTFKTLGKIDFHASDAELVSQFVVPQSSIDHTFHVNNAEYIRWISDQIAAKRDVPIQYNPQKEILELNYLLETRRDETVLIRREHSSQGEIFSIENPRGTSALCRYHVL